MYTLTYIYMEGNYGNIMPNQFGQIPNRGVGSCWKEIFNHEVILNKPYIYEFDLQKFYDRIKWKQINQFLMDYKFPPFLRDFIMGCVTWSPTNIDAKEEAIEAIGNSIVKRTWWNRLELLNPLRWWTEIKRTIQRRIESENHNKLLAEIARIEALLPKSQRKKGPSIKIPSEKPLRG
jgi:hypothetical protein